MDLTPIVPTNLKGEIDKKLLEKADHLLLESAKLTGSHTPQILQAVKDLLYTVNVKRGVKLARISQYLLRNVTLSA